MVPIQVRFENIRILCKVIWTFYFYQNSWRNRMKVILHSVSKLMSCSHTSSSLTLYFLWQYAREFENKCENRKFRIWFTQKINLRFLSRFVLLLRKKVRRILHKCIHQIYKILKIIGVLRPIRIKEIIKRIFSKYSDLFLLSNENHWIRLYITIDQPNTRKSRFFMNL